MDRQKRAYLYALTAVLFWSTVATAFKLTLRFIPAVELVWWASLVSFGVLGVLVVSGGHLEALRRFWRRSWRQSLLLGMINPFVYYLTLFRAYALLPAQEAQAINYTWALMLAFLSVPILKHRLSRYDVIAGVLGYAGVLIIATHGDVFSWRFASLSGVGYAMASTVLWALYWLFSTRSTAEPVVTLFVHFGVGAVWMAGFLLWRGNPLDISLEGMAGALYIGLFEMSVTFVLWGRALKYTRQVAAVSNLIFLSPLLSLMLIHLVVGETISPSTITALGLILAGLALQHTQSKASKC